MTIYFVHFEGDETRVKIGHTAGSVKNRVRSLQTGQPHRLKLIGTIPGDLKDEKRLHAEFKALRIGGEWFTLTFELRKIIELLVDGQHPWHVCRQYGHRYKLMETEWIATFLPCAEESSSDDCVETLTPELEAAIASDAKFKRDLERIRKHNAIHGVDPPWASAVFKKRLGMYPEIEYAQLRYLRAWENTAAQDCGS